MTFLFKLEKKFDENSLLSNKHNKEMLQSIDNQGSKEKTFLSYNKNTLYFDKDVFFDHCVEFSLVFSLGLIIFFISKKIGIPLVKKIFKVSKRKEITNAIDAKSNLISVLMTSILLHMIINNIVRSIIQLDLLIKILVAIKLFGIFSLIYSSIYAAQSIVLKKASGAHDKDIKKFLFKLLRISTGLLAVIYFFQYLGINVSYILALGGFWSIGIGFAAKDIVSNVVSLLAIMVEQSVAIGDMVSIEKYSVEGIIESLGWRSIRIRNYDGTLTILPNVCFIDSPIKNCSATSYRRIKEVIFIEKKDSNKKNFDGMVKSIEEIIKAHEKVNKEKNLIVSIKELDSIALEVELYFYVDEIFKSNISKIKQEILIEIFKSLKKSGCDIVSKKMSYISYSEQ